MPSYVYVSKEGLIYYNSKIIAKVQELLLAKADSLKLDGNTLQLKSGATVLDTVTLPTGGGGTTNYNELTNIPTLNGVEFKGTLTSADLGIIIPTNLSSFANDVDFQTGTQVDTKIATALSSALVYKGSIPTLAELEALTDKKVGDLWNVTQTGMNYAWDGTKWDEMSPLIDTSVFVLKSDLVSMTVEEINEMFA